MDKELLALADDIATHPEIGFEEKRSVSKLTDYLQAARLQRRDRQRRPDDRVRRASSSEQRRADARRDPRIRRAARHQGRVSRRSAQRAGAGRHGGGDRDGRVPRRGRNTPGSVVVYGTPGEEMMPPNAKTVMHEAHVFDGADVIVRSHASSATSRPAPGFGTCCLNIVGAKYTFSGAPTHQMTPWNGRNALDGGDSLLQQHRRRPRQHPARGAHPGRSSSKAARRRTSCRIARSPTSTSAIPTRSICSRSWSSSTTRRRRRRWRPARR